MTRSTTIHLRHRMRSGLVLAATALGLTAFSTIAPAFSVPLLADWLPLGRAVALEPPEIYRKVSPAVVSIETDTGTGSGSIIDPNGLILTNAHVVRDAQTIRVILSDGDNERTLTGEVVAFGEDGLDLAVVQVDGRNLPTVELANPDSVEVGQTVYALGNPFGQFRNTFIPGFISRIDRRERLIQINADIQRGNSGGPLVNDNGEMIGVNTSIFTPREDATSVGIGFAIPVERIQPFLVAVREGRGNANTAAVPPPTPFSPENIRFENIVLNGQPVEGTLDSNSNVFPADNSYFNIYTFQGNAGQQVVLEMTSTEVDSYLILLSPSGASLAQDNDSAGDNNSRLSVTLPTTGTYIILANTNTAGETGRYSLLAATSGTTGTSSTSGTPSTRPAATGTTPSTRPSSGPLLQARGSLGPGSSVLEADGSFYQEHTFEGTAGQRVTISLESRDFDPYLILIGPDGQVIEENDDASPTNLNARLTVTLPQTGTYRVYANTYDSSGRGNYTLVVR